MWVHPLKYKSETFTNFVKFHTLISTQFNQKIKTFQCDLGGEFDNTEFKKFAHSHGLLFRFSCAHTSQQNGRSEHMILRLNDIIRTLLTHAHLPPSFWVEALHTATYLHNILPTKRLNLFTPHFAQNRCHPSYDHLRVFGCACYPNTSTTMGHKLQPRSLHCIFLGYPEDHRGYRCFDPTSGKVIISRHVTFDETSFPCFNKNTNPSYNFLDDPLLYPFNPNFSTTPPTTTQHTPTTQIPPSPHPMTPTHPPLPNQSTPNSTPLQPTHSPPQPPSPPPPQPTSLHPMTTRSKLGIVKHVTLLNLHILPHPLSLHFQNITPMPQSDPNWLDAMTLEYEAL